MTAEAGEPGFGLGRSPADLSDSELRRTLSQLALAQMECALALMSLSMKDNSEQDAQRARAWDRATQAFERAQSVLKTIEP